MKPEVNIFWFRRDLRLSDNNGLFQALQQQLPVVPIFIFDSNILCLLDDRKDARVGFIHSCIVDMNEELKQLGSRLHVFHGSPTEVFKQLLQQFQVISVYTNHDYEPYAIERDDQIATLLQQQGIVFHSYKDQVIFEKDEVLKDDGKPYTVFTPYSRKWKLRLISHPVFINDYKKYVSNFFQTPFLPVVELDTIGFQASDIPIPSPNFNPELIQKYQQLRDIPSIAGTSKLSVHLRFGTISIRQLLHQTKDLSDTFVNELIWRDFYHMILWHFPHIGKGRSFKPAYESIEWRHDEHDFEKWCSGNTGYPIVDAGMRELNTTGFMHNRVRMITASFLCKHLLIDWRWGESYFAKKLLDFDFAANNGGWQWASGSGCDAAPYFRIFNPYLQTQKFDPELKYIRKWIPELDSFDYPKPIVQHEFARNRCLTVYKKALNEH